MAINWKYKVSKNPEDIVIAITGSRTYENRLKIKEMIFKMKRSLGDKLLIVSGGDKDGADKYVKKYCLELGVRYIEFNPAHTGKNLYSAMPDNYYDQVFHSSHFVHRNELIVHYSDKMIVFMDTEKDSPEKYTIIKLANKYNKPIVIINQK